MAILQNVGVYELKKSSLSEEQSRFEDGYLCTV
nr:MAG TPA: hypothetical protein [Caudoviricetes sp.]